MNNLNVKDKIINFIADHGKITVYTLQLFLIVLFIIYRLFDFGEKWFSFIFAGYLKEFLLSNASNLISLSAIFLGIYFTLFTLISTLDINSWITKLPDKRFKEIINLIKNGFTVTFFYVLYLLFINSKLEQLKTSSSLMYDIFNLLNFLFCIYILLTALIIAVLIYTAYKRDLEDFNKIKEQKEKDEKSLKSFISKSNNFVDETQNKLTHIDLKIEKLIKENKKE